MSRGPDAVDYLKTHRKSRKNLPSKRGGALMRWIRIVVREKCGPTVAGSGSKVGVVRFFVSHSSADRSSSDRSTYAPTYAPPPLIHTFPGSHHTPHPQTFPPKHHPPHLRTSHPATMKFSAAAVLGLSTATEAFVAPTAGRCGC